MPKKMAVHAIRAAMTKAEYRFMIFTLRQVSYSYPAAVAVLLEAGIERHSPEIFRFAGTKIGENDLSTK
jgi:hypothetical protein